MTPPDFTAPESRETVRKAVSSRLEEPYEIVSLRKDGTTFDTEVRGKMSSYRGHTVRVTAIRDITERKKNEEALRQSERLYRAVLEQATEPIFLVDFGTRCIVEANPAFKETFGYDEENLGRITLYVLVAADRESVDANVRSVMRRENPFAGVGKRVRQYRRNDGSLVDVEVSASTILRHGKETLCVVVHDVTERVRAQAMLEERVATLARIAAGLPLDVPAENTLDALAQSAVTASTAVACLITVTGEQTGTLHPAGSHGMPDGYVAGLRAAYRSGVRSPTVEAFRQRRPMLVRDLRRFVSNEMEARHGIRVEAALCDEPDASPETKEAVYRIAQEALHNTLKHARASSVKLELGWDGDRIALDVADDGAGFDTRGDFPGHLGLRSMRERAARLGGTLEIESAPGKGTRIRARLPG